MTDTDNGGHEQCRHVSTPFEELDLDLTVGVEYIGGEGEAELAVIHDPEYQPVPGNGDEMALRKALEIADEFRIDCFTRASLEANLSPRNTDGESHLHVRASTDEDDRNGADTEVWVQSRRQFKEDDEGNSEHELVYADPAALQEMMRPTHLDLLRVIARQEPASVDEIVRLVDHDPAEVEEYLEVLDELGLLVLEPGETEPRPAVRYDRLTIHLPLADYPDGDTSREFC